MPINLRDAKLTWGKPPLCFWEVTTAERSSTGIGDRLAGNSSTAFSLPDEGPQCVAYMQLQKLWWRTLLGSPYLLSQEVLIQRMANKDLDYRLAAYVQFTCGPIQFL